MDGLFITMISIYLSSIIVLILLIWFKSDAVIKWGWLFGLSKFLKREEFYNKRIETVISGSSLILSYPSFLQYKYNYNFITSLLACPLCLSIWLSILSCTIISIILSNFLILLLIPVVCVLSLILYGIITKLLFT